MRLWGALVIFLVVGMVSHPVAATTCTVERIPDIQYGTGKTTSGEVKLLLDAYIPTSCDGKAVEGPFSPIGVVHGGGFMHGDKAGSWKGDGNAAVLAQRLAENGYAAFSINYRLERDRPVLESKINTERLGLKNTPVLKKLSQRERQVYLNIIAVEDGMKAKAFVNANKDRFHVKTSQWGLIGMSAGGATVMGMGYAADDVFDRIERPSGVVDLWGDTNESFIESGESSLLTVHGTEDKTLPYKRGVAIYEHAVAVGLDARMITAEGYGHGLKPGSIYTVKDPSTGRTVFEEIVLFFDERLK